MPRGRGTGRGRGAAPAAEASGSRAPACRPGRDLPRARRQRRRGARRARRFLRSCLRAAGAAGPAPPGGSGGGRQGWRRPREARLGCAARRLRPRAGARCGGAASRAAPTSGVSPLQIGSEGGGSGGRDAKKKERAGAHGRSLRARGRGRPGRPARPFSPPARLGPAFAAIRRRSGAAGPPRPAPRASGREPGAPGGSKAPSAGFLRASNSPPPNFSRHWPGLGVTKMEVFPFVGTGRRGRRGLAPRLWRSSPPSPGTRRPYRLRRPAVRATYALWGTTRVRSGSWDPRVPRPPPSLLSAQARVSASGDGCESPGRTLQDGRAGPRTHFSGSREGQKAGPAPRVASAVPLSSPHWGGWRLRPLCSACSRWNEETALLLESSRHNRGTCRFCFLSELCVSVCFTPGGSVCLVAEQPGGAPSGLLLTPRCAPTAPNPDVSPCLLAPVHAVPSAWSSLLLSSPGKGVL